MKLIVGLGNPGSQYAGNRHNIGFMALDRIANDHGATPWRSKFQGVFAELRWGSDKVILLKPETFMNRSGDAVQAAAAFYKLGAEDITVLHDEIDLAPGKVKFKRGGGHAGHNGLRSIHAQIGPDYARVRLGVGHPGNKAAVPSFVLHDFSKADQDWLGDVLQGVSDGAEWLALGDGAKFLNAVALRTAPPRSSKPATKPAAPEEPDPEPAGAAPKSPLERLLERFR